MCHLLVPLFLCSSCLRVCPELASQAGYRTADLLLFLNVVGTCLFSLPVVLVCGETETWNRDLQGLLSLLWKKWCLITSWYPRAMQASELVLRIFPLTLPVFSFPAAERALVQASVLQCYRHGCWAGSPTTGNKLSFPVLSCFFRFWFKIIRAAEKEFFLCRSIHRIKQDISNFLSKLCKDLDFPTQNPNCPPRFQNAKNLLWLLTARCAFLTCLYYWNYVVRSTAIALVLVSELCKLIDQEELFQQDSLNFTTT